MLDFKIQMDVKSRLNEDDWEFSIDVMRIVETVIRAVDLDNHEEVIEMFRHDCKTFVDSDDSVMYRVKMSTPFHETIHELADFILSGDRESLIQFLAWPGLYRI